MINQIQLPFDTACAWLLRPIVPCSVWLAIAVMPSEATAQGCFDTNLGVPLGAGDETVSSAQLLGFSFTWPDGSSSTDAVATSNGRVAPGSSGITPTFVVDGPTFATDSTAIAAVWTDLDFSGVAGDVEFFSDPTGNFATFTYRDAVTFGGNGPFSFQVQLNSDSSFVLRVDNRATTVLTGGPAPTNSVVGWSAGAAVADPGSSDFSASIGGSFNTGAVATAYDDSPFDLGRFEAQAFGNGMGGNLVLLGSCAGFAEAIDLLGGCNRIPAPDPKVGVRWVPNGLGGFNSSVDPSVAFDGVLGPSIGADVDSIRTVDLGFPFQMPGGTIVTSLNVDSNGRVVLPTSTSGSVFSPGVADIVAEEQIAVCWADWVPAVSGNGGGAVYFRTDGVGRALVTWVEIEPFTLTPPSLTVGTFQLQIFGGSSPAADSWSVCFLRSNLDNTSANVVIGPSDGVAGAVEVDLVPGPVSTTSGAHWELFDASIPEIYDIQPSPPTGALRLNLTALTLPAIGTVFDLQLDNLPASAAFGVIGVGFANLSAPLSLIDATNPCLLISNVDATIGIPVGSPTFNTSIDLTGAVGLGGLRLILQALVADFSQPFTIPVLTSNGLDVTLGT